MESSTEPSTGADLRLSRLPQDLFDNLVKQLNYKDALALSKAMRIDANILKKKSSIQEYIGNYFPNKVFIVAAMADTGTYITGAKARDFFFPDLSDESPWHFTCTGEFYHMGQMAVVLRECGVEFDSVGKRLVDAILDNRDYSETVVVGDILMHRELQDAMYSELRMSTDNSDARSRVCLLFRSIFLRNQAGGPKSILIEYDAVSDGFTVTDSSNIPHPPSPGESGTKGIFIQCTGKVTFKGRVSTVILRCRDPNRERPMFHECVKLLQDYKTSDMLCFLGFSHAYHAYYDDTASRIIHRFADSMTLSEEDFRGASKLPGTKVHRIQGPDSDGSYLLQFSDNFAHFKDGHIVTKGTPLEHHVEIPQQDGVTYESSYVDLLERSQWIVTQDGMLLTCIGFWAGKCQCVPVKCAGAHTDPYMLWSYYNYAPQWMKFSCSDALPSMLSYIFHACDPEDIPRFMQFHTFPNNLKYLFHTSVLFLLAQ